MDHFLQSKTESLYTIYSILTSFSYTVIFTPVIQKPPEAELWKFTQKGKKVYLNECNLVHHATRVYFLEKVEALLFSTLIYKYAYIMTAYEGSN